MARFFFQLGGEDSLDFQSVIYFIFNIGPGVGAGVGVDQEPGVGAGVGTAPPRLRTPGCDHDNIASWAVHMKNHASDLFSLSVVMFFMSQDRSAVLIRACHHCRTPVLENHRDDKPPDDNIGHVLTVIYCSWTSSLAQPPKNFGNL